MDLKETRQVVVWIQADNDRAQWGFPLNALMNPRGLHKEENLFISKMKVTSTALWS